MRSTRLDGGTGAEFDAVLLKEQFPDLMDNVDFFWTVLDAIRAKGSERMTTLEKVCEILREVAPPTVLNDEALMLGLCCSYPFIYYAIPADSQLKRNNKIVEEVLARRPGAVQIIPGAVQLENPRLVRGALARIPLWHNVHHEYFKQFIAHGAWRNRDVVLGWVKGGGYLHNRIPQNLWDDQEILQICFGNRKPAQLQNPAIPTRLMRSKEFMLKTLEGGPVPLNQVDEHWRGDRDLALAALSGTHGPFALRVSSDKFLPLSLADGSFSDRSLRFWAQVSDEIRQKLTLHDSFVALVLGSIDLSDTKPSALAVLDHGGIETVLARKKLIAEFAGIPVGDELAKLRKARKNLAQEGFFLVRLNHVSVLYSITYKYSSILGRQFSDYSLSLGILALHAVPQQSRTCIGVDYECSLHIYKREPCCRQRKVSAQYLARQ